MMRATNRLTVTMSVSFRATLAYGSGQGNVGLREKSRTITFGHQQSFGLPYLNEIERLVPKSYLTHAKCIS